MDITCRKTNCIYNKGLVCKSEKIIISNLAECKDYSLSERGDSSPDNSKYMFTKKPIIKPFKHSHRAHIHCKAENCLFNTNGMCIANGTIVSQTNDEKPNCITFLKKFN